MTMTESDNALAERAVNALEAIAEHMGVLATMALSNATPAAAAAAPVGGRRPRGRPRKEAPIPVPEQTEAQAAPPAEPVEPTEDERREKFALLKAALKGSLAMHGEDETRKRLQFNKFSEVPFEAIDAAIERLEA
jgi:hypothetical protein